MAVAAGLVGELIARLRGMGAATVALDLVFAEPDRYGDPGGAHTPSTTNARHTFDEALAATLREGRVVLGYAMRFDDLASEGNAVRAASRGSRDPSRRR